MSEMELTMGKDAKYVVRRELDEGQRRQIWWIKGRGEIGAAVCASAVEARSSESARGWTYKRVAEFAEISLLTCQLVREHFVEVGPRATAVAAAAISRRGTVPERRNRSPLPAAKRPKDAVDGRGTLSDQVAHCRTKQHLLDDKLVKLNDFAEVIRQLVDELFPKQRKSCW